ncbi:Uncharacterized conserved protein, DUF305 family [Amycolatopsis xylanica]|uniref:Uncharacterized conserved protein, DUF305 family n=1 Tax=Amycolatopsis xylanica TaxID=589385 RepID=A0A1H3DQK3_9PSEU|nr:DUF305 domain-containing protein [Amycolatopsis xylanica]SDX68793.1 Uncharacterized conserved protein, DUF305 family [Amycolatopsis xylanica]
MTSLEEHTEESSPERPAWSRVVIIGGALLAVLLVGVSIGVFLSNVLGGPADSTPDAGSIEVGFAQDMSVHHLQAVTMANWARDNSTDGAVKQLAFDIETSQTEQVGRMKGWLMLWDKPEQATGAYMTWMTEPMAGHQHGAPVTAGDAVMPGMATSAELARLRSLKGQEMDVYFLQLMLRHHQGGTSMAQYAKDHSKNNAVQLLTSSILKAQGAEMTLMTQMLAAKGAQPLPAS